MRTALYCPGCGEPCGSAELLANDADLVHITTYKGKRPGSLPRTPVHVIGGQTLRLSDPDGWLSHGGAKNAGRSTSSSTGRPRVSSE